MMALTVLFLFVSLASAQSMPERAVRMESYHVDLLGYVLRIEVSEGYVTRGKFEPSTCKQYIISASEAYMQAGEEKRHIDVERAALLRKALRDVRDWGAILIEDWEAGEGEKIEDGPKAPAKRKGSLDAKEFQTYESSREIHGDRGLRVRPRRKAG